MRGWFGFAWVTLLAASCWAQSSGAAPPSFTLSASPSTITQKQGTYGFTTIKLTPQNGYDGNAAPSLSSDDPDVLANGCYQFVPGGDALSVILIVYSAQNECDLSGGSQDFGGAGSNARPGIHRFWKLDRGSTQNGVPTDPWLPQGAAAAGVMMLLGFRSSRMKLLAILGSALLTVALCGSGCGSGPAVIPKGTYALIVSGTDTVNPSLTASTNVTLVVD